MLRRSTLLAPDQVRLMSDGALYESAAIFQPGNTVRRMSCTENSDSSVSWGQLHPARTTSRTPTPKYPSPVSLPLLYFTSRIRGRRNEKDVPVAGWRIIEVTYKRGCQCEDRCLIVCHLGTVGELG